MTTYTPQHRRRRLREAAPEAETDIVSGRSRRLSRNDAHPEYELTSLGVMLIDGGEIIRHMNSWLRERWRGGGDRVIGAKIGEVVDADEPSRLLSAVRAAARRNQPGRLSHYLNKSMLPLHHPLDPNSPLALTIGVQPLKLAGQTKRGCLLEIVDVTIEANREMTLRAKMAELARVNGSLDILTSAASHDLQTPLHETERLLGGIENGLAAAEIEIPDGVRQKLQQVAQQSEHMRALLDDLLRYCRIGAAERRAARVSAAAVVREAAERVRLPEGFQIIVSEDLPDLLGDRAELALILRNLIANAHRRHDQPTGRIMVTGGQNETESWLSVTDDGPAVEPADFRSLFDPNSVSARGAGVDLGLVMVQRLVHARRGAVTVQSPVSLGRGSLFTVRLPKRPAAPETPEYEAPLRTAGPDMPEATDEVFDDEALEDGEFVEAPEDPAPNA